MTVKRPIEIQQRLPELGRIRLGEQRTSKAGKRYPSALDSYRFTTGSESRARALADRYGGTARPWEDAPTPGSWEVVSEATAIPVIVPPVPEPASFYFEEWTGGTCNRRCTGEREIISGGPCRCDAERMKCKPTLRLSLILPEIPGLGVWRLETHGFNASAELPATVRLLAEYGTRGAPVPAVLRIEHRTKKRRGDDGQVETSRFIVPMLDLEGITAGQLLAGELPMLPAGSAARGLPSVAGADYAPPSAPALPPPPDPDRPRLTETLRRKVFAEGRSLGLDADLVRRVARYALEGRGLSDAYADEVEQVLGTLRNFAGREDGRALLERWEADNAVPREAAWHGDPDDPKPPAPADAVPGQESLGVDA